MMARALPLHHPYRATTVRAIASPSNETKYDGVPEVKLADPTRNYRVLVLGGTGRVGGSTAVALSKLCPEIKIVVAGRNREKGEAMVAKLGENSEFCQVDINDTNMLQTSLRGLFCFTKTHISFVYMFEIDIGKDFRQVFTSPNTYEVLSTCLKLTLVMNLDKFRVYLGGSI